MNSEKIINTFIKKNLDNYFLILEEENKVYLFQLYMWLEEEIEVLEKFAKLTEHRGKDKRIDINEAINNWLKRNMFDNKKLIELHEEIVLENFLAQEFGFYYFNNKETVKKDYLSGKLSNTFKE